jgi:uncharacterized membrane protein YqhA
MTRPDTDVEQGVDRFSRVIGRSRFVVLVAVIAVMAVAVSLFLLGAIQAVLSIWAAWADVFHGDVRSTQFTIQFLEIVSVMLKAVVFYIIGVGLYSLFISPLNITVSLGVQTLNDLESKVVNVVVVILGVTFLEHCIAWEQPLATLQFGAAMSLVIAALVIFQRASHIAKEDQRSHDQNEQSRAQKNMFRQEKEQAEIVEKEQPRQDE